VYRKAAQLYGYADDDAVEVAVRGGCAVGAGPTRGWAVEAGVADGRSAVGLETGRRNAAVSFILARRSLLLDDVDEGRHGYAR
jgi:hypothetical protein